MSISKKVYDCWNIVMDYKRNPLSNIQDLHVRHMVMQLLAWMWCVAFSMWVGSMWIFGFTAKIRTSLSLKTNSLSFEVLIPKLFDKKSK